MAAKPLTTEAIAMTEKKMDMTLDDIIKMSKPDAVKVQKQRITNRNKKFSTNVAADKSVKLRRFMDSRSSLRQGVLAQRRSSFQGNQFPLTTEAARKAAVAPLRGRNFNRSRGMNMNKPRIAAPLFQKRAGNGGNGTKNQQQQPVNVVTKHKAQTLDSLFANMKEQRMKVLSQQNNNNGRRNGAGQQRPRPPWGRYRD